MVRRSFLIYATRTVALGGLVPRLAAPGLALAPDSNESSATIKDQRHLEGPRLSPTTTTGSSAARMPRYHSVEVVNLTDHGAALDGVTNDSEAVRSACAVLSAAGGGVLYHPGGTCLLATTAIIPAEVRVQGNGGSVSIFKAGTRAMTTVLTAGTNVHFDSVGVRGTGATNPGERGVDVAVGGVRFTNARFDNLTNGIRYSGGAANDGLVAHCEFRNIVGVPGVSEGYGVLLGGGARHRVLGNIFHTIQRHAIYCSGSVGTGVKDSVIAENIIDTVNSSHAIQIYQPNIASPIERNQRNQVLRNQIRLNNGTTNVAAIIVDMNCADTLIRDNVIDTINPYANCYGILVNSGFVADSTYRCLRTRIEGNIITNTAATNANDCVAVLNADDTTIVNNVLYGASISCYGIQVATAGKGDAFSRRTRIYGNRIQNCTAPIRLAGANVLDTIVAQNTFFNNTLNEIQDTSTRATISQ